MTTLIVFGTGSSGERVMRAALACDDLHVVGCCDNDVGRQGLAFHGLTIRSAETLRTAVFDYVVLASMYAAEIRRQLVELGIPDSKIVTPDLTRIGPELSALSARALAERPLALAGGTMCRRDLPGVLVLTSETLNDSHGTGVLLRRYFSDFPEERLFSVFQVPVGTPTWRNNLRLSAEQSVAEQARSLSAAMAAAGFVPRLVYAAALNENDLIALEAVLTSVAPGTPVIQHFMDFIPHDETAFVERFRALEIAEVWALTASMAAALQPRLGRVVRHVGGLHQTVPVAPSTPDVAAPRPLRLALLGNLWQPQMFPLLCAVWRRCRDVLPELRPIDWYVHPERVQALVDSGFEVGDEIVWRGFYSGRRLQEQLRLSTLAVLPFNPEPRAANGYSRFSLPSRLTELCGAGLPIFAIAGIDTEPARFVAAHACGRVVQGPEVDPVAEALIGLLRDEPARRKMAARARAVAERDFALEPFRRWFVGRIVELAAGIPTAAADTAGMGGAASNNAGG